MIKSDFKYWTTCGRIQANRYGFLVNKKSDIYISHDGDIDTSLYFKKFIYLQNTITLLSGAKITWK